MIKCVGLLKRTHGSHGRGWETREITETCCACQVLVWEPTKQRGVERGHTDHCDDSIISPVMRCQPSLHTQTVQKTWRATASGCVNIILTGFLSAHKYFHKLQMLKLYLHSYLLCMNCSFLEWIYAVIMVLCSCGYEICPKIVFKLILFIIENLGWGLIIWMNRFPASALIFSSFMKQCFSAMDRNFRQSMFR